MKTHIPDKNSWEAFTTNVKQAMIQSSPEYQLTKKDYSEMMQYYINSKSYEEFVDKLIKGESK